MTVEDAIRACEALPPPRRKKLVAVSGGRDSVALLHALVLAGHRKLVVCHLNHRLRGRASAADAAFVKRLAASLGLPCETSSANVKLEAAQRRRSLETAGREARHHFFAECAQRHRCRDVVLAHHGDDQVETVLFNLIRGAGGLRGMEPRTSIRVANKSLHLIRPLLTVTRSEIDAFAARHSLKFREDATNAVPDTSRNRLRLEALPALSRAAGRDIRPAVLRALELYRAEDDLMDSLALSLETEAPDANLPIALLDKQPVAIQRRVLLRWLTIRHALPGIGFSEVESVRAMLTPNGPRAVNLPGNHFVRRRRKMLTSERPAKGT